MSPALMVGVEVEALILKSTTSSICERDPCIGPPFALAVPETLTWVRPPVMDGVRSTSTAAPVVQVPVHAAKFGMLHWMLLPLTGPQVPVPPVTFALALDASPVVGTVAMKVTLSALSGPRLMMSNVNAT